MLVDAVNQPLPKTSSCEISLEIVPQSESSAKQIMSWRNDPQTLAQSFDSAPKQWPAFYGEFLERYCQDATLPCLFVLKEGRRVGFIRFRRLPQLVEGGSACDVSINLDPAERGRGTAAPALEICLQVARNAGVEVVVAEIKEENVPSQRAFEKAGFIFLESYERDPGSGQVEIIRRFIRRTSAEAPLQDEAAGRKIGSGHPCFIIAEAGSNWRVGSAARDLKMAKTLIDVAAEAGADAVKFQTYKPATTYVANAGQSDYLSDSGIQESITEIFADLAMPYEMLPELAGYARAQNILFMSSPFSVADFDAINPHTVLHKIASYEISHARLIAAVAQSGKPAVLSTGASDLGDIEWAVDYFQSLSRATLCLMQCTARYPAPLSSLNLGALPLLRSRFGLPVGLSDHTREPIVGPLAAVALGADLIEKHYTLDNRLPGPDHAFAITAPELKLMVQAVRQAEQVVGTGSKVVQDEERELYDYARRGLQAVKDISRGDALVEGVNIDILRPGKQKRGIHPRFIDDVQNKISKRDIRIGDGVQFGDFE